MRHRATLGYSAKIDSSVLITRIRPVPTRQGGSAAREAYSCPGEAYLPMASRACKVIFMGRMPGPIGRQSLVPEDRNMPNTVSKSALLADVRTILQKGGNSDPAMD